MPENNPFSVERNRRRGNPFAREKERRAQVASTESDGGENERRRGSRVAGNSLGVFLTRLLKNTGNGLLSTPDATIDMVAGGLALGEGLVRGVVPGGEGFEIGRRYRRNEAALPDLPRPTTDEVIAGGRAVLAAVPGGVSPRDQFRFSMENADRARSRQSEEDPTAAAAGDMAGSIAALLIAKSPLQATIKRLDDSLTKRPDIFFGSAQPVEQISGVARAARRAVTSNLATLGARGGLRAAETGLEAAYLEAISEAENDPLLAAALAAGGQVIGSVGLQGLKVSSSIIRDSGGNPRRLVSLGVSALAAASLWQIVKGISPGGRDRILESSESGFQKISYGVMLGALGSVAGRGRGSDLFEDFLPASEAAVTIPRAAIMTLIADNIDGPPEERQQFEQTLSELVANPQFEGRTEFERDVVRQLREATKDQDAVETRLTRRGTRRVL